MTAPNVGTQNPYPELAFEALFEQLPDAILVADDAGRYVFANSAACRLLGLTPPQILQRTVADLSPDREAAAAAWEAFLRDGRQQGEFELLHSDGSTVPVDFNAIARIAPNRHVSILRDVSDRKRIENLLRLNEERFVKAFIGTPAPTNIRVLETGTFLEVNDAFTAALGFWRSDVIGHTAADLGLWLDEAVLEDMLSKLRDGEQEVRTRSRLRSKDRTEREFSVAMRRMEMHGEPHVIAVYWDLGRN